MVLAYGEVKMAQHGGQFYAKFLFEEGKKIKPPQIFIASFGVAVQL